MNGIDFEQELYKHFGQIRDFTLGMRIGQYFYDLGCRRTADKYDEIEYNRQRASGSSEIPNYLEEAAEKHINEALFKWSYDDEDGIEQYVHDAFIAGAEWQESQMPMPEDTVLFNKGVQEGRRLEREDMMKDGNIILAEEE